MEVERNVPELRARGNIGPPAKKTVSAAAVFRNQGAFREQGNLTRQTNISNSRFTRDDADATTLLSAGSHSSVEKRVVRKSSSNMHPLGVEFKDASDKYRRHLYKTASSRINKTLEKLLHTLYESTLQTVTRNSNQQDLISSPLKISAPAKYERLATQLYQPISQFTLSLRRTDSEGKSVRLDQTLETRMIHYDELITKETAKLAKLQKEWEVVLGEIWKLGAACLGKEAMEDMLFTKQPSDGSVLPVSSSPSKVTDAESTLFVSEHESSPAQDKSRTNRKRVTFLEEEISTNVRDKNAVIPTTMFPKFIYQPSRYRKDTLPLPTRLPDDDIENLDKKVKELGRQELSDMREIEKEHQAYWKKKTAQLAVALKSD
ncbi:uncharacterized protein J4E84_004781 [Alternaria hordeiaustralica]|uniref:uncharacterized protein n=1 Tax=Alternaria hordeiaustralica TaxID=1187925 RepID=UPI0020C59F21|nr:uncharacterized protein J4E84_004781 [Alternaria hordeiaustralica]KAI4688851.1 hypothetical protein J4E84_004781 [Alternaria hordeiaustralica]